MNVSCPECSTIYRVDPAKVPNGGVRARCSTCDGVISIGMASAAEAAAAKSSSDPIGDGFAPRRPVPSPFIPFSPALTQTPQTPPRAPTPPATQRVQTPPASPRMMTPPKGPPALGASLPPMRTTPRTPWQPMAAVPLAQPAIPVSVPPVTPQAAPYASAIPSVGSSMKASAPVPGERRPVNPFLARDPGLRAKRLARALVSDMVAYYPAKHSEGLEKGTLKELFRDEIRKSYDEYVAQVGSDFARTTTHFQESLNEILGAGKKIF